MLPPRLGLLAYLIAAAVLIGWCARSDFARQGDGWEYLAMLEAFDRHASPDIRPGDLDAMFDHLDASIRSSNTVTTISARDVFASELPVRFRVAPDGHIHAAHFWMYSLVAYPAKAALRAVGGREFNALIVTNAWLFAVALGSVLFLGTGLASRRLALAAMLVATPVAWYVPFTGVELFSWALVTIALVCLERGRYGACALAAGVAATQNPPLAFVAAVPLILAVGQRRWRSAGAAALGASVALLPAAFYLVLFGTFSLIARTHFDATLISWSRTASLLVDLDAGLLPYVPVLLVAALVAAARLVVRGDRRATLLAISVVVMMLAVQVQVNWNSDGRGLQRYLVWMLPLLAWLVLDAWPGRVGTWIAAASVVVSGAVLVGDPPAATNWLEHRALARLVLSHAPRLYNPEFETFAERSAHTEAPPEWVLQGRRDGWMASLPVAHGRASGEVTKLLVDRASASRLEQRYRIDPSYLPVLLNAARASETPTYVHPPAGTVWAEPGAVDGVYGAPRAVTSVGQSVLARP